MSEGKKNLCDEDCVREIGSADKNSVHRITKAFVLLFSSSVELFAMLTITMRPFRGCENDQRQRRSSSEEEDEMENNNIKLNICYALCIDDCNTDYGIGVRAQKPLDCPCPGRRRDGMPHIYEQRND